MRVCERVGEQLGAAVEGVGDDLDMAFERLRDLAAAVADGVGDLLGAGAERLGHLAGALADDVVEVARLLVERHFEDVGAGGEGRVVLFERGDQVLALVADDGVERLEAGVDDDRDLVEAGVELAEALAAGGRQGDAGALDGVLELAADFDQGGLEAQLHRVDVGRDAFVELSRERAEQGLGLVGAVGDVRTRCASRSCPSRAATSWPRSRSWSRSVMPPWLRSLASDEVRLSIASDEGDGAAVERLGQRSSCGCR